MRALVDTTVWSLIFRRKETEQSDAAKRLELLLLHDSALIIGAVRQEVLSGISDTLVYEKLRIELQRFSDMPVNTEDYELAANFSNICRRNGIQGSNVDFLICAIAHRNSMPIFTTDKDFDLYAKYLPIRLM